MSEQSLVSKLMEAFSMATTQTQPPPIDPVNETIVTVNGAARHYKISPATAWRMILDKRVASFKVGSSRRTSLEAFRRYIESTNGVVASA